MSRQLSEILKPNLKLNKENNFFDSKTLDSQEMAQPV